MKDFCILYPSSFSYHLYSFSLTLFYFIFSFCFTSIIKVLIFYLLVRPPNSRFYNNFCTLGHRNEGIDFRTGGDLNRIFLDETDSIVQAALAHMPSGGRNTIMDALALAGRRAGSGAGGGPGGGGGGGVIYQSRDTANQSVFFPRSNGRNTSNSTHGKQL